MDIIKFYIVVIAIGYVLLFWTPPVIAAAIVASIVVYLYDKSQRVSER